MQKTRASGRRTWSRIALLLILGLLPVTAPPLRVQAEPSFTLLVNQVGFRAQNAPGGRSYMAPKGSRFMILDDTQSQFVVRFSYIAPAPQGARASFTIREFAFGAAADELQLVTDDTNYVLAQADMPRYNYQLQGGTDVGILAVPFKMQFHDGTLTAGATVGPFIGRRQRWLRIPTTILGAVGLSGIPVQDVNGTSVETKLGLTSALGVVGELPRQFQFGVVFGLDHLGGAAGDRYRFEDKLWVSFAIGFAYTK